MKLTIAWRVKLMGAKSEHVNFFRRCDIANDEITARSAQALTGFHQSIKVSSYNALLPPRRKMTATPKAIHPAGLAISFNLNFAIALTN